MIHDIDPVIGTVLGIHLWWYGLAYSAGFVVLHVALRRYGAELGLERRQAWDLVLLVSLGTLLGGRVVEVAFYEWPFYRDHLHLIPAYWLGGMSTHGLLLGAIAGILLFCRIHYKSFLAITDALAVPAAFILAFGRIGNFIDGQIVGIETSVPWAIKFPDADGFRHPTVLYDGIKNLLLVPVLLAVQRRQPPAGAVTGLFLFLYAFLRIGVDVLRVYPTSLLGLATGQALNIATSIAGLALLAWACGRRGTPDATGYATRAISPAHVGNEDGWLARRFAFASLVVFPLVIPSDWTQDVPERYGKRHPGLRHSTLYPAIPGVNPAKPPPAAAAARPKQSSP